ncbi:hypothetical protein WSM22_26030 [Cytophagales bacterium WSM2-2]|nr:hypothetical protein WSM22_26030 [Cytophagales bacterium WSM2-2]
MINKKEHSQVDTLIADAGGEIGNCILKSVVAIFLFDAKGNFKEQQHNSEGRK